MEFRHSYYGFKPDSLLANVGVNPVTFGPAYYSMLTRMYGIIEAEVLVSATKLNQRIQSKYERDMDAIPEYSRQPRYKLIMKYALKQEGHVGVYWDGRGLPQAKFIDTGLLGDLGDLQRIAQDVGGGDGTARGWRFQYIRWLKGGNSKYTRILDRRLDQMSREHIAPFWQLIEDGNGPPAYPVGPPMRTLSTFYSAYQEEMRSAYQRCMYAARLMANREAVIYRGIMTAMVLYNGANFYGNVWTSRRGTKIFAVSGKTSIDDWGRVRGEGFILNDEGSVLKKWSGWLPR